MLKYLLALCLTGSAQAEVIRQSGGGTSTGLSGTVSCANGSSVNIDGGTLYVDCTNNRVGVVNSAPGYPLDVVGAVHATGQAIIGGTGTVKGNAFSVGGSTLVVSQGQVGVGQASPGYPLDVTGDSHATGQLIVGGTATVKGAAFSVGGSTLVVNQGLVGIGTAQPSVKLHLSSGTLLVDGSGADVQFPAGVVGTAEIANAAIDTDKLATDAVTSAKVLNAAVTTAKIADLAVDTAKLAADAVTAAKIINSAVETAKIAADAVTAAKIINGAIETDKLATDAVTTAKILNANVTAAKLVNAGVFTGDATTTFPALTIGAGAIDTGKLATDSVTSDKLLNDAASLAKVSNQVVVNSGGKIGVGTSSPAVALDVVGSAQVSSTLTVQGSAFSVGGSTMVVTQGFVGIGLANPSRLLELKGDGDEYIRIDHNNATGAAGGIKIFTETTDTYGFTIKNHNDATEANRGLYILNHQNSVNGSTAAVIQRTTGNMGIRDASPDAAVEILALNADAPTSYLLAVSSANDATGNILAVQPSGKVGINVANPGSQLDVSGTTSLAGAVTVSASTLTVGGNAFSVGGSTLAVLEGKVGIGVTAPTAKLHMSSGALSVDGTGAAINTTGQYKVKDMVAFSSVPIMHAGGFNSTLGSGTTFFAFVPDSAVTLRRITATIVVAGIGGTGDTWFCSDGTNSISVTTGAEAAAGTVSTATGSAGVAAGVQVNGRLEATGGTSPAANVLCEYSMQ